MRQAVQTSRQRGLRTTPHPRLLRGEISLAAAGRGDLFHAQVTRLQGLRYLAGKLIDLLLLSVPIVLVEPRQKVLPVELLEVLRLALGALHLFDKLLVEVHPRRRRRAAQHAGLNIAGRVTTSQ